MAFVRLQSAAIAMSVTVGTILLVRAAQYARLDVLPECVRRLTYANA